MDVSDFEQFVRQEIRALAAKERSWFDEEVGTPCSNLVLYGLGSLGRRTLKGLETLDLAPVAIADATLSLKQSEVEGIPCLSPADACARFGEDSIFVVAVFDQSGEKAFSDIGAKLRHLGAKRVIYFLPFFWKYAETFLPYYSLDLPSKLKGQEDDIMRTYDRLSDQQSKTDYASFFYHLLSPEPMIACPVGDGDTYFPRGIVRLADSETFVDGGAFDGDTLAKLVLETSGHFARYIGIEPDPANLRALEDRIATLQEQVDGTLEVRNNAIGSQAGKLSFAASGQLGSALDPAGNIVVTVRPLADLIGAAVPTYIKLDIEGAELDALSGAEALLSVAKPKLAVCVYHRQSHFWQIPALMHEFNPSCKLFFRRHREYLDDVVAYAIPK